MSNNLQPKSGVDRSEIAVGALQIRSWRWWLRVVRLGVIFVVASSWAYATTPHELGLTAGVAFGVVVLAGAAVGAAWDIVDRQDFADRMVACAVLMIVVALISLVPGLTGHYSVLGPTFQLGIVSGLALISSRRLAVSPQAQQDVD